ncbi:hypothetical protein TREAZ_3515 [Leadbettera azotonutricia ZAS-9]|uniref:Uncharacterized protein n=1 Tax=Leadbettera azotonutricia (strain ATCC BAA-888 / DSM 13862 / ZAS-9) TaxID=545695 RepID=F5Y7B8_LEAAZ|nr:hypothetical protein TREAZ_3515 [Leadbettera azotonutricia ZAS-9]
MDNAEIIEDWIRLALQFGHGVTLGSEGKGREDMPSCNSG